MALNIHHTLKNMIPTLILILSLGCEDAADPINDPLDPVSSSTGGALSEPNIPSTSGSESGSESTTDTSSNTPTDTTTTPADCTADESCEPTSMVNCTPNEVVGCTSDTAQRRCNATGSQYVSVDCPEGEFCLNGMCGDQRCIPNDTRCSQDDPRGVERCSADGTAWIFDARCDDQTICQGGECQSGCALASKLNTYIGCEYWTIDLDNYPDPFTVPMPNEVPHSVVLSNSSTETAQIQFETRSGVGISIADPTVPPGESRSFTMPRLDVDGSGITFNSIKIVSSTPVSAYQFNPLNNENVFSNDASLLLPVNTFGREYLILSWPTGVDTSNIIPMGIVPQAGYFTVVATSPGMTDVTITVSADSDAGPDVPALSAGESHTFQLEQFQVLNIQASAFVPENFFALFDPPVTDLSGSQVQATQPIAVFSGHEEAVIGSGMDMMNTGEMQTSACCADHLEEQLFPVHVWTTELLCIKAPLRGAQGEKDHWRVISSSDANQITTVPPITGLHGITLNDGEWVEIDSDISFTITGTAPLMAAQYLISQTLTDEVKGDPAMILAVPTGQYRSDYNVLIPEGYSEDWLTVVKPVGATVLLNDQPIQESFEQVGDGRFEVGYLQVDSGMHSLIADQPFGLIAYGWNNAVSYGYPAGLNLRGEDFMLP